MSFALLCCRHSGDPSCGVFRWPFANLPCSPLATSAVSDMRKGVGCRADVYRVFRRLPFEVRPRPDGDAKAGRWVETGTCVCVWLGRLLFCLHLLLSRLLSSFFWLSTCCACYCWYNMLNHGQGCSYVGCVSTHVQTLRTSCVYMLCASILCGGNHCICGECGVSICSTMHCPICVIKHHRCMWAGCVGS